MLKTRKIYGILQAALFPLDVFLLLAVVLLPVIWIADPLKIPIGPLRFTAHWRAKVVLLPTAAFLLRVALSGFLEGRPGAGGLLRHSLTRQFLVWVLFPFLCFYGFEQYLQARNYVGFMPGIVISDDKGKIGSSPNKKRGIIPDWELLHKFNPGAEFRGRTVNSMGFLDREVEPKKAEKAVRVICMGDSITGQGPPPYSHRLHELLQANPPTNAPWEPTASANAHRL